MSMREWTERGFGIDTANITNEMYCDIINKHKDTAIGLLKAWEDSEVELLINTAEQKGEVEDLFTFGEVFEDYTGFYGGSDINAFIADIMSDEQCLRFEYHCGEYDSAIMLSANMPWVYNNSERKLTEDDLTDIFKVYFPDLYPDMQEIEYYG